MIITPVPYHPSKQMAITTVRVAKCLKNSTTLNLKNQEKVRENMQKCAKKLHKFAKTQQKCAKIHKILQKLRANPSNIAQLGKNCTDGVTCVSLFLHLRLLFLPIPLTRWPLLLFLLILLTAESAARREQETLGDIST